MRTLPAKVVVWLGLHEGAFPRQDKKMSLNLLTNHPNADFMPSQTDFDRYSFLEGLLSARDYFIMSYLQYSPKDLKEQAPSLIITELMNAIDNSYEVAGGNPSFHCHFKHPYQAFDKSYFSGECLYPSYSKENYAHAMAYYHLEKKAKHHFIPHFITGKGNEWTEEKVIDLKELTAFARNPLKTYFNKALGIFLENQQDKEWANDEKFQLNRLERDHLKKLSLKCSPEKLLNLYGKKGRCP